MQNKILFFIFIISSLTSVAQEYNAVDAEGKRHGKWQKKYDGTDHLRYEGTFDHGKEIGEFKFYRADSGESPSAIKVFSPTSDTVHIKYFSNKGALVSEGVMVNKNREGVWKYYHRNSKKVMMTEEYKADKLDGEHLTYFDNGQLTEKVTYKEGKKEGERIIYSNNGVKIKLHTYMHDVLHGPTKYYDTKGKVRIEGDYKKDRKDGVWKYYKDGKLSEEKIFPIKNRK